MFFTVSEGRYPYPRWVLWILIVVQSRPAELVPPSRIHRTEAGDMGNTFGDRGQQGAGPEPTWMYSRRVSEGVTHAPSDSDGALQIESHKQANPSNMLRSSNPVQILSQRR